MSLSIDKLLRVPDIRNKILITLGLLFVYRIGFFIPLPGVNYEAFLAAVDSESSGLGKVRDMMNILTGAKLQIILAAWMVSIFAKLVLVMEGSVES